MEWLIAIITGVIVQEGIKEVTQVTNGGTRMLGGLPVEMITMLGSSVPVSYTHLTLPTNREV